LPRWSVGANVAYADGRIKNGTIACTDLDKNGVPDTDVTAPTLLQLQNALPPGENVATCSGINQRALTSPKFSANLQSEFGFRLAEKVDGFVRGSSTIFGKTRNDPTNTFDDVGVYGLLNLFAGIREKDGPWELTVFGKNILRQREVLSVGSGVLSTSYRTSVSNTFRSEYRSVAVNAPREFGVTLRVATGSR
jgi:iron complex outermembrane receptor protein